MIVFAKGSTIRCLLLVIYCFTASFGLRINLAKSSFVPLSISSQQTHAIEQLLRCKSQSLPVTYLGMPLTIKAPKRQDFLPLLQKLERRLEGWKTQFISRAGKLQLVKTVLSSIPTYFMSCFIFPKWLLDRIDIIRRRFLWSRDETRPSIPLLNWRTVCLLIPNGGLGVVNLHLQNIALLFRWL